MTADPSFDARVARVFAEEGGAVLATLARRLGSLDAAEEALQEAWVVALSAWRAQGLPERPGAWLLTAGRRRAIDRARRRRRAPLDLDSASAEAVPAAPEALGEDADVIPDDQLRLVFTCCAPGLPSDARVALTLRLVAGLSAAAIARAFLVPEATIAQRIVRAKRLLREHRVPYEAPGPAELPARLPAVLEVVYLAFNEGYSASEGKDLLRHDLVDAALRLGRTLAGLLPKEPSVLGLLALMELQASRGRARTDARGDLVLLEDQDRALWDRDLIDRGLGHLHRALALRRPDAYQIQAAIAACHAEAASSEATDWPQILALYDALSGLDPSPVVDLNRAVAVAMVDGPGAALPLVERLAEEPALRGHHRVAVVRADLLRRLGRRVEAEAAYRRAHDLAENERERRFLARRADACRRAAAPRLGGPT
jgi:RNA polymerase sigma-70 factor (ECF subfamily)